MRERRGVRLGQPSSLQCLNLLIRRACPGLLTADAIAGIWPCGSGHVIDGADDVVLGAFPRAVCRFEDRAYT